MNTTLKNHTLRRFGMNPPSHPVAHRQQWGVQRRGRNVAATDCKDGVGVGDEGDGVITSAFG